MPKSVFNINMKRNRILNVLRKIYRLKKTNKISFFNPYYKNQTSQQIIKNLSKINLKKSFFDLKKI